MEKSILCSDCFKDYGLKKMAERIGSRGNVFCPNCGSKTGATLNEDNLDELCSSYFVNGSYNSVGFGGSPVLMMMDGDNSSDYTVHKSLEHDIRLILKKKDMTPTAYGPAMWRVGITEWMERLTSKNWKKRDKAVEELIARCNVKEIDTASQFYRIRTNLEDAVDNRNFDAPNSQKYKGGRFNVKDGVVFYASFDVETCIHECRVSMEDVLYVATLEPCRTLRLLDLSDVTESETEYTPFEDLPLAVKQIFGAGEYSYGITRTISKYAKMQGFDGIIYPSYFNSVRNEPFVNIVLYGQVIKNNIVRVKSIDRIRLNQVEYKFDYGPSFRFVNI